MPAILLIAALLAVYGYCAAKAENARARRIRAGRATGAKAPDTCPADDTDERA